MKVTKMTFTGKRDNRKFNRMRGGYCVVSHTNRVAKVISYRRKMDGTISLSCLVDNGTPNEHTWQMVRNNLTSKVIGVVSKEEATRFATAMAGLQKLYEKRAMASVKK